MSDLSAAQTVLRLLKKFIEEFYEPEDEVHFFRNVDEERKELEPIEKAS